MARVHSAAVLLAIAGLSTSACSDSESAPAGSPASGASGATTAGGVGGGGSGGAAGKQGQGGAAGNVFETGGSAGIASSGKGGGGDAAGGGNSGGSPPPGGIGGAAGSDGGAASGGSNAGGAPPNAGTAGNSGMSGAAGMNGGSAGDSTTVDCAWDIAAAPSTEIPTVGIVDWSTDLDGLSQARVEFTLNDAGVDVINRGSGGPISVEGTTHRALLLGLKPERTYTYRIVARAGSSECTSPDQTLATGALPSAGPSVTRTSIDAAAQARGFIVTTAGLASFNQGPHAASIIDGDGDVVWWWPSPVTCSRAHMSWEGTDMWMLATNFSDQGGEMQRVSMDGLETERVTAGISEFHHDFTVLPRGIVAGFSWARTPGTIGRSVLIERSPDGALRTVVDLDENVYLSAEYHANAVVYHPEDETYTVGDLFADVFVKVDRMGEVLWQFGGDCTGSPAPKCRSGDWNGNHGHHLMSDGKFVLFSNFVSATMSAAVEYTLTETDTSLTAEPTWSYGEDGAFSQQLGDVQRLPNGNTLVVYSNAGIMREVTPGGEVVQALTTYTFGYASFRETLYGPPLR